MRDLTGKSVNANQRKGMQTYTGKLCFYEKGIMFKAQSVNGYLNMPLIEYGLIVNIKERNTLGFIPNGITIQLMNGETIVFVVSNRNEIITFLREKTTTEKMRKL